MVHQICNWAKYQNKHSSKSIKVIKLSFYQNDSPMGGSFWQKDSLITYILFELCLFWYLSPVANLMHHSLGMKGVLPVDFWTILGQIDHGVTYRKKGRQ